MLDQYGTPRAFRQALETRLMAQSRATAVLGDVRLAGKSFASVRMDVVARAEEIADAIEPLIFSSALAFAGLASSVTVPAIDVAQHGAEKFHALTRTYGQRPNTRVKDLVDLVLLAELDLIDPTRLAHRVRTVFRVRDTHLMPAELPEPPSAWRDDYLGLIEELDIGARTIEDAMAVVRPIWRAASRTAGNPSNVSVCITQKAAAAPSRTARQRTVEPDDTQSQSHAQPPSPWGGHDARLQM